MRVLLAHKTFHVTGGGDLFFLETGRVLKERGHEVAWFSTASPLNVPCDDPAVFVDPPDYVGGSALRRSARLPGMIYSLEAERRFAALLADFRPDVVHAFAFQTHLTPSILRAAKRAGVPVVVSCNDYKHVCPNYKLYHHGRVCTECRGRRFHRAVANRCCKDSLSFSAASAAEAYVHRTLRVYERDVDRYLFASRFMARVTAWFWPERPLRWSLVRNPFAAAGPAAGKRGRHVLYFGRLVEEKGVDVLLRAAAAVPGLPLRVVGDGPLLGELTAQAQALGLRDTRFVGPKWGAELDEYLDEARFVVVPSLWHENLPYVVLQAFAAGKAVVGSDRGGIPELVEDGVRGSIYPAHDDEALAAALRARWDDEAGTAAMGEEAARYVAAEFSDDRFYASLMAAYEAVVLR